MDPFLGEIKIFGLNFAPRGWALCNGQLLSIAQNTALFSLLGTNYGGNGQTNFALPNFQGTTPVNAGQGPGLSDYFVGQIGGTPTVTLATGEMAGHNHAAMGFNSDGGLPNPNGNFWAGPNFERGMTWYSAYAVGSTVNMNASILLPNGGNQQHNNMMPYLTLTFCIATEGIFPPRS